MLKLIFMDGTHQFLQNMQIRAKFLTLEEINAKIVEDHALVKEIEALRQQVLLLQSKCDEFQKNHQVGIDYLSANMNTSWILRNDMKKIKNKLSGQKKKDGKKNDNK